MTLKKIWIPVFFAFLLIVVSCSRNYKYSVQLEDELINLDAVMAEKSHIEAEKEARIEQYKLALCKCKSLEDRYWIYDRLADEYRQFKIDSAMVYSDIALQVARRIPDRTYYYDAVLDLAERYAVSGMYHEVSVLLENLDTTDACMDMSVYYHRKRALNQGLAMESDDGKLTGCYRAREKYYENRLISVLDTNDIRYKYICSEMLMKSNRADEALKILEKKYHDSTTPINEKAIIAYLTAQCFSQMELPDSAVLYLARSARMDLMTPNYSYRSLCDLSSCLFRIGDVDRAYRYMMRAIEDISISRSSVSLAAISDIVPVISETYDIHMYKKNDQLRYLIVALSLVLVVLFIVLGILFREKSKVTAAQQKTNEMNDELRRLNERLERYICRLQESNTIKESYIGRYLDMCSEYIDALAAYRSEIRKVSKGGSLADVQNYLRSSDFIDNELNKFYVTFDTTFLDLFPNFIDRLNDLLQPDKRITVDPKEGIMTTELRIMALIRLGVTDSVKISNFLRRSPSTVYNYRVKFRNAALNSRDNFEKQVMSIGRL